MSDPQLVYRKSTRSQGSGNCVEFAEFPGGAAVSVRDSKDEDGPTLTIGAQGWSAFIADAKAGRFDLA